MIRQNLTLDDFNEALTQLDTLLDRTGFDDSISIRAIGGFAMQIHGLRKTGVTADIDTVTASYPPAVQKCIGIIAEEMSLPPDWINNDSVFTLEDEVTDEDVKAFDSMLDAAFIDLPKKYKHINISVASVETLIKSKVYATCDIGQGRTTKDLDDLLALLAQRGITTRQELEAAYPWIDDLEFDNCNRLLKSSLATTNVAETNPAILEETQNAENVLDERGVIDQRLSEMEIDDR